MAKIDQFLQGLKDQLKKKKKDLNEASASVLADEGFSDAAAADAASLFEQCVHSPVPNNSSGVYKIESKSSDDNQAAKESQSKIMEDLFSQLNNVVFHQSGSTTITIGQWISFLGQYSKDQDTMVNKIIGTNETAKACIELIGLGCCDAFNSAEVDDHGLLYFINTSIITLPHVVKFIYVILPSLEVRIAEEKIFNSGIRPAHSQLAKGAAVLAAGELIFRKANDNSEWQLDEINNGSGHYRPTASRTLKKAKDIICNSIPKFTSQTPKLHNCLFTDMPVFS
jgi:hypothetical protein